MQKQYQQYSGLNIFSEKHKQLFSAYYKMSRFKTYQQLQADLSGYDLSGKIAEVGISNGLIYNMCDVERSTFLELRYPTHDMQNLSTVEDDYLDVYICDNTLEHIASPQKGISECYRVLRNGGIGIFIVPFIAQCQPDDYHRFSKLALHNIFKRFSNVTIKGWGNREAAACYIKHDKWVTVDKEEGGLLHCYNRKIEGWRKKLPNLNDEKYPIHYFVIVKK